MACGCWLRPAHKWVPRGSDQSAWSWLRRTWSRARLRTTSTIMGRSHHNCLWIFNRWLAPCDKWLATCVSWDTGGWPPCRRMSSRRALLYSFRTCFCKSCEEKVHKQMFVPLYTDESNNIMSNNFRSVLRRARTLLWCFCPACLPPESVAGPDLCFHGC